ncbi:hypothetical protein SAMN05421636_101592 [Pricia antarctica]|uniref:Uncharacterized protein n=1 Tax=Pricia antarctica TaxID=641691 RepID=A0A1G6XAE6_9FLAO|nr:hypothetical protein SAMN05421636_101592 [Pricia antarctica]
MELKTGGYETKLIARPKLYIANDIHKRTWKVHCNADFFSGKSFNMLLEQLLNYLTQHFPVTK